MFGSRTAASVRAVAAAIPPAEDLATLTDDARETLSAIRSAAQTASLAMLALVIVAALGLLVVSVRD